MYSNQIHKTPVADNHKNKKPFFQPKLTINEPNDPDSHSDEHEADVVAEKIMRMPAPSLPIAENRSFFSPPTGNINKINTANEQPLKKENKDDETEELLPDIQPKLSFDGLPRPPDDHKANDTTLIQRKCAHCEEEERKLQRKEINAVQVL